jgi:hypothetical protein
MGSSPDINYPAQPSYGDGMADAMKAQMQQLLGQGDYAQMYADAGFAGGDLGDIIAGVEAPIRQKTAQVDTDVLRQTLLGSEKKFQVEKDPNTGKYGITGAEVVKGEDGKAQTAGDGRYDLVFLAGGSKYQDNVSNGAFFTGMGNWVATAPTYGIIDTKTGGITKVGGGTKEWRYYEDDQAQQWLNTQTNQIPTSSIDKIQSLRTAIADAGGDTDAAAKEFQFENPYTGEPLEEGQTVTIREGDGMIDLLGDKRNVQEFTTRQATEEDVAAGLASEVGESITESTGNRQAGFDAEGNFLGLSAMAEDIQRGNLSRQRESDLADVERLSDRFQNVMEDYKPGTVTGIQGARDLLEEQKEAMTTGGGAITIPSTDTYAGDIAGQTMDAATVADPLTLKANTQFTGELATGEGTLRSALLGDAKTALSQGLTDRETRSIQDAARARSTMMGRTFDQSGAIAEAEARVQEDNARRMQNRSFAQSVMGQDAGLQQGDITRGMAQESEQAGLQQQVNLAQAQMDQQANAFGAQSAQSADVANQRQAQQAAQFGVGATMDAERANETLRQQGLGNYINAVGNLARIEDQSTLDPFQALLGRAGGGSLQAGGQVFGQAGYGLNSGPQYLNPESGLGYISQMAANEANMYGAQLSADATRDAGMMNMIGSIAGAGVGAGIKKLCWVAREVYGPTNPAWLQFRKWMFTESPNWFFKLYAEYGERFANWISNKPRIKSIIRKWMDSKIGE